MRHRKRIDKLSRPADLRKAMLRNIVTSLFERYSVQTTVSKAKAARKVADRLITYSISGTLADKRRIISYIKNRDVAHKVIKLGQDNFSNRSPGGYTAVYNIGWRKGDGARIVLLQLLVEEIEGKKRKKRAKGKIEHDVIEVDKLKKPTKRVKKEPIEKEIVMEDELTVQELEATEEIKQEIRVEETETVVKEGLKEAIQEEIKEEIEEVAEQKVDEEVKDIEEVKEAVEEEIKQEIHVEETETVVKEELKEATQEEIKEEIEEVAEQKVVEEVKEAVEEEGKVKVEVKIDEEIKKVGKEAEEEVEEKDDVKEKTREENSQDEKE